MGAITLSWRGVHTGWWVACPSWGLLLPPVWPGLDEASCPPSAVHLSALGVASKTPNQRRPIGLLSACLCRPAKSALPLPLKYRPTRAFLVSQMVNHWAVLGQHISILPNIEQTSMQDDPVSGQNNLDGNPPPLKKKQLLIFK